jgi:hypothetical protein
MMVTKPELVAFYGTMVQAGEGDMLHAEISECTRLKKLYTERLRCLLDRNPRLALIRAGDEAMYPRYEDHFCEKIRVNTLAVEAALEVLSKWQRERNTSKRSTRDRGDLVCKRLDSQ